MNPWLFMALIGCLVLVWKIVSRKLQKDFIDFDPIDDDQNIHECQEIPEFLSKPEKPELPPITDIFSAEFVPGQYGLFMSRPYPYRQGFNFEPTVWDGLKWRYEDGGECFFQNRVFYGLKKQA